MPQLKSKKENIKSYALNILINIKIICFIQNESINDFYNKIEINFNNRKLTNFLILKRHILIIILLYKNCGIILIIMSKWAMINIIFSLTIYVNLSIEY